MNEETIKRNKESRELASEIFDWIADSYAKHGSRFLDELMKLMKSLGWFEKTEKRTAIKKMTDVESNRFGREIVPFGEFIGKHVDDVGIDRLDWYAAQTFVDKLRRYLLSDRIMRERTE